MNSWITQAYERVQVILRDCDASHNADHAYAVWSHAHQALKVYRGELSREQQDAIELAALLHDVDDRKIFPGHNDFEHARTILREIGWTGDHNLVIEMIDLVACSKNGNRSHQHPWMLYPRYADRLEAIGEIGIERCMQYTLAVGRPLHCESTLRCSNHDQLEGIIVGRFEEYLERKVSDSFIDHCYDKLLHIGTEEAFAPVADNEYLMSVRQTRHQIIEEYVLQYWKEQRQ